VLSSGDFCMSEPLIKEPFTMSKEKLTHQHLPLAFSLVVLLFAVAACSSTPSESAGRKFIEDKGAEKNLYRVKSFTKTNGVGDEHAYTMEYKAELECVQPGAVVIDSGGESGLIHCEKPGQVGNVQSKLVFERTENGWRVKP
jgi:hypothetical protein